MHRRLTDALERDIAQWECIRRVLDPGVAPHAMASVEREIERLRHERAVKDRPKVWGRRATDLKPNEPPLRP